MAYTNFVPEQPLLYSGGQRIIASYIKRVMAEGATAAVVQQFRCSVYSKRLTNFIELSLCFLWRAFLIDLVPRG